MTDPPGTNPFQPIGAVDTLAPVIEDQYKSSWQIPNSLLIDLRLHLFAGRRRGERLKATEVAEEAIHDLLEAGGLEAFRERADSLLDHYEGERMVAVRVALPYDTVGEIRRQALIEDQHGHWWSTGKVLAVALDRHLAARRIDIVRASWDLSDAACDRLTELCEESEESAGSVVERLILAS